MGANNPFNNANLQHFNLPEAEVRIYRCHPDGRPVKYSDGSFVLADPSHSCLASVSIDIERPTEARQNHLDRFDYPIQTDETFKVTLSNPMNQQFTERAWTQYESATDWSKPILRVNQLYSVVIVWLDADTNVRSKIEFFYAAAPSEGISVGDQLLMSKQTVIQSPYAEFTADLLFTPNDLDPQTKGIISVDYKHPAFSEYPVFLYDFDTHEITSPNGAFSYWGNGFLGTHLRVDDTDAVLRFLLPESLPDKTPPPIYYYEAMRIDASIGSDGEFSPQGELHIYPGASLDAVKATMKLTFLGRTVFELNFDGDIATRNIVANVSELDTADYTYDNPTFVFQPSYPAINLALAIPAL